MDQAVLSTASVPETLLESNRPPADTERVTIHECIAPADVQLRVVEPWVFQDTAHIQALEQTETELQCLHNQETGILETAADRRQVLSSSSFQNMPEDVLREICAACIGADFPALAFGTLPLPYKLMQICSGMRHVVLTASSVWSSINIRIIDHYFTPNKRLYTSLVREARKWFERAGELALSISVENQTSSYTFDENDEAATDPANILFDFLLSFSSRWKLIRFSCPMAPTFIDRIAALSAVDVPQLRSVSLRFHFISPMLGNSAFFTIPTLDHLTLETYWIPNFDSTVNWARLTSLTLRGCGYSANISVMQIAGILQRTRCLSFCDVSVGDDLLTSANHPGEVNLPFLRILHVDEVFKLYGSSGILDLINAPMLERFQLRGEIIKAAESTFFMRSPNIRELSFCYGKSLSEITEVLKYCPSVTDLSLQPHWRAGEGTLDINMFLKTFVQENTCPHLEYFTFVGSIDVSLQTLCQFLEAKQRGIAMPASVRTWRGVSIDLSGIADVDERQQMLDLFSRKLEEGMNVGVVVK